MSDGLLLSDLRAAAPAWAVSTTPGPEQWGIYEYETASVRGVALYCRPFANPPELTIRVPAEGHHRIFIGIHYGHTYNSHAAKLKTHVPDQFLSIRLSDDRAYDLVEPEYYPVNSPDAATHAFGFSDVLEVLWRCADLTGRDLQIAPRRTPRFPGHAAGIAWLRLERMTQEEIDAHTSGRQEAGRRLIYIADTDLHEAYPSTPEDVHRLLDPLAGSDFSHVLWTTCFGDICYYPSSRFPRAFVIDGCDAPYGYPHESPGDFDVLQAVTDTCHELGLRIHAMMRPAASRMPPLHWPRAGHDLFHDDPDVLQVGRAREPIGHYSFAHPRVRETFTDVFREQLTNYALDGIHILWNRGWPFVGCEDPVVEAFARRYGEDATRLDPMDPRWLAHICVYLNDFVQGLREMLDEVGGRKGRRLDLSVTVMAGLEHCRFLGLDVEHWLRQGWLDHIIVHPCWLPNRWQDTDVPPTLSVTPQRIAEVKRLTADSGCRVYADVYPRYIPPADYPHRAMEYYASGADGLCFWDTYSRVPRKSEWNVIRHLGNVDGLEALSGAAQEYRRVLPLVSAAGMSLDPSHTPATNG